MQAATFLTKILNYLVPKIPEFNPNIAVPPKIMEENRRENLNFSTLPLY